MRPILIAILGIAATTPSGVAATSLSSNGHYAEIGGVAMYYEDHGDPKSPGVPLVLLHGGGSSIDVTFAATLPRYAKSRRVIARDEIAHGRTVDAGRALTFATSADDVVALLDHLGVQQADVLGFSNGGSIAMQVAIRHPARVRKLVVMSAMTRRDGMQAGFWDQMAKATLADMPKALQDAYVQIAPRPEDLQVMHDRDADRMRAFEDWPDAMVRGITMPTLVMAGDRDVVTVEHATRTFRLLPRGALAIVPGDHATITTDADVTVPIVTAFLDAPMPTTPTTRPPRD